MSDNEISQILGALANLREDVKEDFAILRGELNRMRGEINELYGFVRKEEVRAAGCAAQFEELERQVETVAGRGEKNIDRANDFFTLAKNIAWVVGIIAVAVAALVKLGVVE